MLLHRQQQVSVVEAAASDVPPRKYQVIEAAYNFYRIEPVKVSERAGTLTGLLVFYVLYTLWWGFALTFLVEGMGLTMTKKGAKKED